MATEAVGKKLRSPSSGSPSYVHPCSSRSKTSRFDMPMKSATYSVAGSSKISSGRPSCSSEPLRMIASRSPSARASTWSCVTYTAVNFRRSWSS